MNAVDLDDLPVGIVRVDTQGTVVETNRFFREWAECDSPAGKLLSDFLVPVEDFIEAGPEPAMMLLAGRPERAAFVIEADDGATFTVIDASARYAAGQALRDAHALADRTRSTGSMRQVAAVAASERSFRESPASWDSLRELSLRSPWARK